MRGVRSDRIELVGQVRLEGRAHLHISLDPTCVWESEEEPWRSQPSEELEEQAFLGNCWAGHCTRWKKAEKDGRDVLVKKKGSVQTK